MTNFHTDLSHHDWTRTKGELDFKAIKGATSGAVCLRATYGDPDGVHYPTQHFGDMTKAAKAAGFTLLGAYHNLVKGDQASINRQVDWLRSEMDKYGSNWAMLDVERYQELLNNGYWPRWDDVQQFHDRWYAVDKRTLAFYIPDWVWDASLGRHDLTGLRGPLVASEYGNNPTGLGPAALYTRQGGDTSDKWHAYGGRTPEILQYGSKCQCPGASGSTDANAYRGTFAQLTRLLLGTPAPQPPQEDEMEQSEKLAEKTDNPDRTVGDHFADEQNLRNFEVSPASKKGTYDPPADSRIQQLHANAAKVPGIEKTLSEHGNLLALILKAVNTLGQSGVHVGPVDLTPEAVAAVAEASADEIHNDPERDGV